LRRCLFSGFLLAITLAAGCADETEKRRAPAIAFAATTYDFGRVAAGAPVGHDFGFINQGDLDLTIDTVKAGCNCMVTLTPGSVVAPGGRGAIAVALDTSGQVGPQRRTVTVYANDPQRRATTLALSGEVVADVSARPARLYIGHVHRGEEISQPVTVLATADGTRIDAVSATRCCDVRSAPLAHGRHGQTLTLTVKDDAQEGPVDDVVEVRTTPPEDVAIRIPVTGVIDPDLVVSPDRLDFEVVAGTSASRALLLENGRRTPITGVGVKWPAQFGRAELQTLRDGVRYRVVVTLSDQLAPGTVDALLEIGTDQATIRVPVSAVIRNHP